MAAVISVPDPTFQEVGIAYVMSSAESLPESGANCWADAIDRLSTLTTTPGPPESTYLVGGVTCRTPPTASSLADQGDLETKTRAQPSTRTAGLGLPILPSSGVASSPS